MVVTDVHTILFEYPKEQELEKEFIKSHDLHGWVIQKSKSGTAYSQKKEYIVRSGESVTSKR